MDTSDDAAPWSGSAESGAAESWILNADPWSRDVESLIMDTSDDAAPWSGAPKAGAADS
jgi:hypothetical protein